MNVIAPPGPAMFVGPRFTPRPGAPPKPEPGGALPLNESATPTYSDCPGTTLNVAIARVP